MTQGAQMMREYETIYVLKPEMDDKSAKEFMLEMKELITEKGGQNVQVTCMGRRKLAWMRDKIQRGIYVKHTYLGMPGLSKEFERLLGINESVMLRQTVLLARDVDPSQKPEVADSLEIVVVRDKREQQQSYFDDDDSDSRRFRGPRPSAHEAE